jgi:hypothetical protein
MTEDKVGSWRSNELFFVDWVSKVAEKLLLITQSIKNQTELIPDDDVRVILEPLHKVWFMGELPFFRSEMDLHDEVATQGGLFGQTDMTADVDIKVEVIKSTPKKKK